MAKTNFSASERRDQNSFELCRAQRKISCAKYHLHLKGYVGGYDFDSDYVDYVLSKNPESEVHVLIDSLGGSLATALSIVAAFREHGNVHVHFVGMNASAATIASMGAKRITMDASAMYLVHKCSVEFFRWASANSDKLADITLEISNSKKELGHMKFSWRHAYNMRYHTEKWVQQIFHGEFTDAFT